jgi:hypothetical protein
MSMTFKKMLLVTCIALAAIMFSAPASATALEWTDNGEAFEGEAEDILSGEVFFGNPAAGQTKFGCEVHGDVIAHGITQTATLVAYEHTTAACEGEGIFAGCVLIEDSTTGLPADIHTAGTNTLTVTGPIVIHKVFEGHCPIEKTTLTISDYTLTLQNSSPTHITLSGLAEAHSTMRPSGVETTQTVAMFGTVGTETDTLSIE